jgi:hypothetical protein
MNREKGQFENQWVQVESMLNRANSLGYHGDDFREVNDLIVARCCEADEEKVHNDLIKSEPQIKDKK